MIIKKNAPSSLPNAKPNEIGLALEMRGKGT